MEEDKILQPINEPVNAVILETEQDPTRWVLGATSKIEYKELNSSGNWLGYLPTDERQSNRFVDSWGCTNFGGLSVLETQLNFQIANNLLSPRALAFLRGNNCANISYIDQNNKVNFSDKFTYIKTGTRVGLGNYVYKTPDSARNVGLIPEAMLPWGTPKTEFDIINPAQITPLMDQLAGEFKEMFVTEYEEIKLPVATTVKEARKVYQKHMKQAPLTLAIACCSGYSTSDPIPMCYQEAIHCVGTVDIEEILTTIYDSYPAFVKRLGQDYLLPYVLKSIIYENNTTTMKAIKTQDSPHIYLLNNSGDRKIMIVDMPTLDALQVPVEVVSQEKLDSIQTTGTIIWAEREI